MKMMSVRTMLFVLLVLAMDAVHWQFHGTRSSAVVLGAPQGLRQTATEEDASTTLRVENQPPYEPRRQLFLMGFLRAILRRFWKNPNGVDVQSEQCPEPSGFGICIDRCTVDGDCNSPQVCCSNGCGHDCMDPAVVPAAITPNPTDTPTTSPTASPTSNPTSTPTSSPNRPLVSSDLCPKPTGPGVCVNLCTSDNDCTNPQICCSNGCGHLCMDPEPQPNPSDLCPILAGGGPCVELCSGHSDCTDPQICCTNGCGHECTDPVILDPQDRDPLPPIALPKPLPMPPVASNECPEPTGFGICVSRCTTNADCPGPQICCSNGCGHDCIDLNALPMPPVAANQCPQVTGTGDNCVEACSNNEDCTKPQICCSNNCGHQCMDPETGDVIVLTPTDP